MQRTNQQNRAIHLYFRLLADTLNDAGLDMRKTLKPEIDIPWTEKTVKEYLWRPIQKAQLGKDSSKDLTKDDLTKVWETLNRHLSQKHGITEPFPSIDELIYKEDKVNKPTSEAGKRIMDAYKKHNQQTNENQNKIDNNSD